jgi:signal transduction histidine kinase
MQHAIGLECRVQRVFRIGAAGLLCAALVLVAGWGLQRLALGGSEADARTRIEREVRDSFGDMARGLREVATEVADPSAVNSAVGGDNAAARRLFAAADAAVTARADQDLSLTVYASDGRPLAWGGRPSEIPSDRLQASNSAWFFAQGPLGLRLVYVAPVMARTTRIGTIATERALPGTTTAAALPARGPAGVSGFRLPTSIAPVSIRLPFEDSGARNNGDTFDVSAPSGDRLLTATIAPEDVALTRARWRRATVSLSIMVLAITVLLMAGPALDDRNRARQSGRYATMAALAALAIVGGRILLRAASFADWSDAPLFSGAAYASTLLPPFLTSPFDFLATAFTGGSLVALAMMAIEAWRVRGWPRRRSIGTAARRAAYVGMQLVAGAALATVLIAHAVLIRDTIEHTSLDLLHFSLHPWNGARLALQIGLIVAHTATIALGVLILRLLTVRWCVRRHDWRVRLVTWSCWLAPLLASQLLYDTPMPRQLSLIAAALVVIVLASYATRFKARFRHGSQAFRLTLLTLGLVLPAIAFYPTMFRLAWEAKSQLIETTYAPEAINQRQTTYMQLTQSLADIDAFPDLAELIAAPASPDNPEAQSDRAFQLWQTTALAADYPLTSSVELYGPDGKLVSRFAFNLPDDLTATTPRSEERSCDWDLFAEVAPFFAEDRGMLHAGRAICGPGPGSPRLGSIIVHTLLDYENLPFISSENPYLELLRPSDRLRGEGISGRDVEFAFYGWSGTPLFASRDTAWRLDDSTFARLVDSRMPFWTALQRGDDRYDVYLLNDRGGIYALGFPIVSFVGHLVNLAELTVLALGAYVLLLAANALFGALARRGTTAPALLREIRASFYRKLFLAFVAAVILPVAALALLTRYYVAEQMRASVEQEAIRTASAARRVVEDLVAPRAAQQGLGVDDNLMVWVSRLIDQDVNVFTGPRLVATSERNLFASGLLPTRTPADVYHALELGNEAATVTREHIGGLEYLVAASRLRVRQLDATLTVPLTSRQQEIDAQIDTLDRRVLLGALLFILAGAGLGYSMAERISDPVNRLTRATRRIASGDFDARIATTSSDELRRLVEDFNKMAADLQRQRAELERTHRLEAWAEMARQVAHEIKNPLTPIQLNAEHLRRVHADRGEPLGPILRQCVDTILTQVRLLRQIASEFSSFASSPTARPARVDVPELLHEIIDPYRAGLDERIRFEVAVPPVLPPVFVDRTLITRSLTNIVENALHAMPGNGTLTVVAGTDDHVVSIRVSDTGVGMDAEALARAFEPYFSTKATGTGLGLPIAKRNVELSGGSIDVVSERDKGTTVELRLPVAN